MKPTNASTKPDLAVAAELDKIAKLTGTNGGVNAPKPSIATDQYMKQKLNALRDLANKRNIDLGGAKTKQAIADLLVIDDEETTHTREEDSEVGDPDEPNNSDKVDGLDDAGGQESAGEEDVGEEEDANLHPASGIIDKLQTVSQDDLSAYPKGSTETPDLEKNDKQSTPRTRSKSKDLPATTVTGSKETNDAPALNQTDANKGDADTATGAAAVGKTPDGSSKVVPKKTAKGGRRKKDDDDDDGDTGRTKVDYANYEKLIPPYNLGPNMRVVQDKYGGLGLVSSRAGIPAGTVLLEEEALIANHRPRDSINQAVEDLVPSTQLRFLQLTYGGKAKDNNAKMRVALNAFSDRLDEGAKSVYGDISLASTESPGKKHMFQIGLSQLARHGLLLAKPYIIAVDY
ncbi:hypothetical protein EJ08DRAFT_699383 [Tothia fuscella]|uniref:Uncharacterized protein n=1 Tax=Tothia fuscella TaxID=1048955 RepID=A0A9P4TX10_9PEZI|nr:hypothetical protein EJ08DRAFT_699383 [Tothia fuscella]